MLTRLDEAGQQEPDLIVTPEASYPAYFLHSREAYEAAQVYDDASVEAQIAERAKRYGCTIAAGLVQRVSPEALSNASVLFGPDGEIIGRYAKSFLWHFDNAWFVPGDRFPVFEVTSHADDRAAVGLYICADGRLPEIPRALALGGAQLLAVSTAWVSSGRERAVLTSPQVEYLTPARAIENGTWIVAADKVGTEAFSISYAGRSGVVDPSGQWIAQAPPDQPGLLTCTIDLDAATGPPVARRPELYAEAAVEGAGSAAGLLAEEPLVVAASGARVAAAAMDASPSAVTLMEAARRLVRAASAQHASLVVLPDLAGEDPRSVTQRELLPLFEQLAAESGATIVVGLAERADGETYKTAFVVAPGGVLAAHRQTHLLPREQAAGFTRGEERSPLLDTPAGHLGLLAGAEGLVPELARTLKLRGAEVIAWTAGHIGFPLRTLTRARANEERAYVVAAGDTSEPGGAYVVDPTGAVLWESLSGQEFVVSADVNRAQARWNRMAPDTDPVLDRRPRSFHALFRRPDEAPPEA